MARFTPTQAASNGAKFLDKYDPTWYKENRIKTEELDLENGCFCIIGQLNYRDYDPEEYLRPLVAKFHGLNPELPQYGDADVYYDEEHDEDEKNTVNKVDTGLRIPGFTLAEHENIQIERKVLRTIDFKIDREALGFEISVGEYSDLTDAWLKEIHKRRAADKAASIAKRIASQARVAAKKKAAARTPKAQGRTRAPRLG